MSLLRKVFLSWVNEGDICFNLYSFTYGSKNSDKRFNLSLQISRYSQQIIWFVLLYVDFKNSAIDLTCLYASVCMDFKESGLNFQPEKSVRYNVLNIQCVTEIVAFWIFDEGFEQSEINYSCLVLFIRGSTTTNSSPNDGVGEGVNQIDGLLFLRLSYKLID